MRSKTCFSGEWAMIVSGEMILLSEVHGPVIVRTTLDF
jgi:hypothetical protein